MRIILEVYEREGGGYVAVATQEGALVGKGSGTAAALTAIGASLGAITHLFAEKADAAVGEKRALPSAQIQAAILNGDRLRIVYRDAAGLTTLRRIIPKIVDGGTLRAWDIDKSAPRSFSIQGIQKVDPL